MQGARRTGPQCRSRASRSAARSSARTRASSCASATGTPRRKPVEAIYTFPLPSRRDARRLRHDLRRAPARGRGQGARGGLPRLRRRADRRATARRCSSRSGPTCSPPASATSCPARRRVVEVELRAARSPADEGALRWMHPDAGGAALHPRRRRRATAPATAARSRPTAVPDADRITPRIGEVHYGLALDLVFDLGREVEVESPSHAHRRAARRAARARACASRRRTWRSIATWC